MIKTILISWILWGIILALVETGIVISPPLIALLGWTFGVAQVVYIHWDQL